MILVDSSVWIDYFRGAASLPTDRLDRLLGVEPLGIGDLMLLEILQGARSQSEIRRVRRLLNALDCFPLLGRDMALRAAANYRALRARGITVRKTIDNIIATFCIHHGYGLLFGDRDFEPFVAHLGLRDAMGSGRS